MEFTLTSHLQNRAQADLLVLPFWKGKKQAVAAVDIDPIHVPIRALLATEDFTGKEGEVVLLYPEKEKEPRVAILGLGDPEKATTEKLRRAYSSLAKKCSCKKVKSLNVLMPHVPAIAEEGVVRGVVEGLLLANYSFDKMKHESLKEQPTVLLTKAALIGISKQGLAIAKKYATIASAVHFARDLVNDNADDISPQCLGELAHEFAKKLPHVKTTVFNKKRIEKEKMGLILAVSRGSFCDPAFIIMEYNGNPKSKDRTAIIGKGVTYDTGGLNLKPVASLETMRCDMGGAAVVFGTIKAAAELGMKVNLIGVVPATENAIGPNSFKPGDVYKSYDGKTVEIKDPDAEGRLILADALAYVRKNFKPTRMIDFATLTGSMEIALGKETTGMMSNQDALADSLIRAGYETYERLWRLPLYEEYKEQLKSDLADIKNTGGRPGGAITAALFLQEFVGDIPWAHCDIAGTAFLSESRRYHPKYATGIGVRLFLEFLENL